MPTNYKQSHTTPERARAMGNVQIGYATDSWPQPQAICGNQLLHKVKHTRRRVVGTVGGSNQSALLALLASSAQQGPSLNQLIWFLMTHPIGVASFLIRSSLTNFITPRRCSYVFDQVQLDPS